MTGISINWRAKMSIIISFDKIAKKIKLYMLFLAVSLFCGNMFILPEIVFAADLNTIYKDIKEKYPNEINTMYRYGASDSEINSFICTLRDELITSNEMTPDNVDSVLGSAAVKLYILGNHISVFDALANGWGLRPEILLQAYDEGGVSSVAALLPESLKEIARMVIEEAANFAVIDGYVSLYMGDPGTGLNNLLLNNAKQEAINETFKNIKFIAYRGNGEVGAEFNGSQAFIPNNYGNLAVLYERSRIAGKFRLNMMDTTYAVFRLGESGYLNKDVSIALSPGQNYAIGTESNPIELYPGDLGQVIPGQGLVLIPDGKINHVDFSAWLKIYKDKIAGKANNSDILKADLTKDGVIDNVDFSLWLATYRKTILN